MPKYISDKMTDFLIWQFFLSLFSQIVQTQGIKLLHNEVSCLNINFCKKDSFLNLLLFLLFTSSFAS